ncbi:MAG: hypothetical protein IPO25_14395 [Saprospiraceae bacterium]|nr:hypothetical protein [Saprospiraceae bacterium]
MSNENKKSDSKKNAVDERGDKIAAKPICDWRFQGRIYRVGRVMVSLGQHTTLGSPLFNEKNELIGLEEESIEPHDHGLFGALRSPNFKIDQGFIESGQGD